MKKKSVLLVDDEEIILKSLGTDLNHRNFTVATAPSGEDAITLLQSKKFDVIITDLSMPGPNGIQVLQEAKLINPFTVVILLTGYGDMTSAINALRLGADDYLLKPCELEELVIRIERCLEKQEAFQKIILYEEILPVCCVCGDIRDDRGVKQGEGVWMRSGEFITEKTSAKVTHTYCQKCYDKSLKELQPNKLRT